MATLNVVLRTDLKADTETGEYPLMLRLYHTKNFYPYSFSFKVAQKYWNKDTQQIKRCNFYSDYGSKNHIINQKIKKANKILESRLSNNPDINPDDLRNIVSSALKHKKSDASVCYIQYLKEFEQEYKEDGKLSTSKNYKYHRHRLKQFIDSDRLEYVDITPEFVGKYFKWLKYDKINKRTKKKGLSHNSVCSELNSFKHAYKNAQRGFKQISKEDPFFYIDLKREPTEVIALNESEIKRMIDLSFQKHHKKLVRDMYVFSIYSGGLRFSDCIKLQWDNVNLKDEKISFVPHKTRAKKKGTVINPLGQTAIDILKEYKSNKLESDQFVFDYGNNFGGNVFDNKDYERFSDSVANIVNPKLKEVAKRANIDKNLSFHISRYTIGNILLQKGMTVNGIKEMFNHSSLAVTKQYIKRIKSVDNSGKQDFLKNNVTGW